MGTNRERRKIDQKTLKGLIRKVSEQDIDKSLFSDDIIIAFLTGDLSRKQTRAIQGAMVGSGAFCRRVLRISEELEAVESLEIATNLEKDSANVPSLEQFLEIHGIKGKRHPRPFLVRLWNRIGELALPSREPLPLPARLWRGRVLAVGTVTVMVAAVAIISLPRIFLGPSPVYARLELVSHSIDKEFLITAGALKGVGDHRTFLSADSAALAMFANTVEMDSVGNLRFHPITDSSDAQTDSLPLSYGGVLQVEVYGENNQSITRSLPFHIAVTFAGDTTELTGWIISLPSRDLYRFPVPASELSAPDKIQRKIRMSLVDSNQTYMILTFTKKHNEGYVALGAFGVATR